MIKNFFTADGRPRGSESVVVVGEEVGALGMVRVIVWKMDNFIEPW